MTKLVNRAKMTTATTGTGTITLGSAVDGYQTFADAGVANTDVVRYVIEDGNAWEIGTGTYTASGTTLSRTVSESSNSDAAINLTGNAVVFITAVVADILQPDNNLSDLANASTARTNLGLGTIATQAANNVSITGGSITGITDLAVSDGGTGASSFTANNVLLGNGASSFQTVAPGTSGNVLTSNGTTWTSATPAAGYTNSDVDAHLNVSTASSGEVLSWTGSDYDWIAAPAALDGETDSASPFETSLGNGAGAVNTGVNNTFIGFEAGNDNTTGTDNVAVGYQALDANTTGQYNVAMGSNALGTNTTGGSNTALGYNALLFNTTGASNVAVGRNALYSNTTGTNNVAVGLQALYVNTTGTNNVAVGFEALDANTSGYSNIAVGGSALGANTTGIDNTAVGYQTLDANTTGTNNVAMGNQALGASTTASDNVAIGRAALFNSTTASNNVAIGRSALFANTTGASNTAVGYQALDANTTGANNVAVGRAALGANTTASNNTAIGYYTLQANTTGTNNLAVGYQALYANTIGINNVALGYNGLAANTTGTNNTAVGYQAADNLTTGTNNTVIGYNAKASSATASNEITLGNSSITTLRCQVTTISSLSDARDKTNISDLPAGLTFVNALRPVEFDWNMRDGGKVGIHDTGFIAQDLQAAQEATGVHIPYLVYDNNPDKLEAGYGKLIPVLVKAIQELSAKVESLEAKLEGA